MSNILCLFSYMLILYSFAFPCSGQVPQVSKKTKYEVEAGVLVATGPSNPFWQQANQYGEVPLESNLFTLRAQAQKDYDSTRKFSYGYGIRTVLNTGSKNQIILPELYAKIRYGVLELYAGRRREIVGLVDTTLTSGSYIWSGNALPVPKIQIGIPNYTRAIFKSGILAVKGQFSHGWFGSSDSSSNYFLHQSSLYLRIGKPVWRFKLFTGINHQAQWGGKPVVPYYDTDNHVVVTEFQATPEAYFNIVTGIPISYFTNRFPTGGKTFGEENRLGNHLGTVDICLQYENANSRWLLYRQSIYDDGSLYHLNNISDGLSGISFTNHRKNSGIVKVVIEYLRTSNQGGPLSSKEVSPKLRGQDNYFNNGIYEDGWVYKQQTIGTAFLMPLRNSTGLTDDKLKKLNPNHIYNNRVDAFIISVQSRIKRAELISRVSTSNNRGNYKVDYPLSAHQLSVQQQISFPIRQYKVSAGVSHDRGELLRKNTGLFVLVKRQF